MATAFGKSEQDEIRSVLRRSAWNHACAEGMKNTSVDQLAAEAGISKGAFYHFYRCKELLFLEVLSRWHQQLFENVEAFMKENSSLAPEELAKVSLKRALHLLLYNPAAKFILTERDVLLRRVSPEAREKLYRSDEAIVRKLIDICGVTLNIPIDTAVSMIRLLLISTCHADEIGPAYDDVIEKLIDG
ncbi:MAG: TetR/AcrR family transcriptional regulator, partial [Oscillospiraceae bacterium]|nr:TetR/AcrR family transcriptional regulator [Oscillospiraceae bacterium]